MFDELDGGGGMGVLEWTIIRVLSLKEVAVLKGLQINQDCDFSTIVKYFKALMVSGWNILNGVDPWMTKKDLIGKIKV